MRYFVTDRDLIPIACQPEEGYSMTEAIARYNREVNFMKNFCRGELTDKEIEYDFHVIEDPRKVKSNNTNVVL